MTTQTQTRFIVKEVVKFGLLFGYVIFDTKNDKYLPFEFSDDEKYLADSKCELQNILYK